MVEEPYQYVQKRMESLVAMVSSWLIDPLLQESKEDVNPSMVSHHITQMKNFNDAYRTRHERALKDTSSTAFLGMFLKCHMSRIKLIVRS